MRPDLYYSAKRFSVYAGDFQIAFWIQEGDIMFLTGDKPLDRHEWHFALTRFSLVNIHAIDIRECLQ